MVVLLCFCILYGGYKATTSSSVIMTETEEQNPASLRYILAALFIENVCWALEQDISGIISYRLPVSILQMVRWMNLAHTLMVPIVQYSRAIDRQLRQFHALRLFSSSEIAEQNKLSWKRFSISFKTKVYSCIVT